MGKQSRLKAQRREAALSRDATTDVLRHVFARISQITSENPRRCWEYMVELMAHYSGINCLFGGTLTEPTKKLAVDIPDLEDTLLGFTKMRDEELLECKRTGSAIPDPIGLILEENQATNKNMDQFFTPPTVIRAVNAVNFHGVKKEKLNGLDPCCGTGRFAMDALVHNDGLVMFNVDLDQWLVRAALVNFRYMQRYTHARITPPLDARSVFEEDAKKQGDVIVLGGRSWIIHANSLVVDLEYKPNWQHSWMWNPPNWRSSMKMADFDGTYEEFEQRGSKKEVEAKKEQIAAAPKKPQFTFGLSLEDESMRRYATGRK